MKTDKPLCYGCRFRGDVPGSAHSSCKHPEIKGDNKMAELFSLLGGNRRVCLGLITEPAAKTLEILGDPHGIRMGWFNWPYNFDPVWLRRCKGFEPKGGEK